MADVATLSNQQATTSGILAPTTGSRVTVTSISQAQGLIASREQQRAAVQDEWITAIDYAAKWSNLAATASSDSVRLSSEAQAERYEANSVVLERELDRLDDEIKFYQSELERLRKATGLPGTQSTASTAAASSAAAKAAAVKSGLTAISTPAGAVVTKKVTLMPFGLTTTQALALVGIPLFIVLVMNLSTES